MNRPAVPESDLFAFTVLPTTISGLRKEAGLNSPSVLLVFGRVSVRQD